MTAAALLIAASIAVCPTIPVEPATTLENRYATSPSLRAQVFERVWAEQEAANLRSLKLPAQQTAADAGRARLAAERAAEAARIAAARAAAAEAEARAAAARRWQLPVGDYRLTARFGQCGSRWARCHAGLDFAADTGSKVRAMHGGAIVAAGWAGAYGWQITIDHGSVITSYSHLSRIDRRAGWVATGDLIGLVGSTGNTTGPHVHVEVHVDGRAVDPYKFLAERGATP